MYGFLKEKSEKWQEGKSAGPLNFLEVTSSGGGGAFSNEGVEGAWTEWLPTSFSAPLWSEAAISNKNKVRWYLTYSVLFATLDPASYVQAASGICTQLPAMQLGIENG